MTRKIGTHLIMGLVALWSLYFIVTRDMDYSIGTSVISLLVIVLIWFIFQQPIKWIWIRTPFAGLDQIRLTVSYQGAHYDIPIELKVSTQGPKGYFLNPVIWSDFVEARLNAEHPTTPENVNTVIRQALSDRLNELKKRPQTDHVWIRTGAIFESYYEDGRKKNRTLN